MLNKISESKLEHSRGRNINNFKIIKKTKSKDIKFKMNENYNY